MYARKIFRALVGPDPTEGMGRGAGKKRFPWWPLSEIARLVHVLGQFRSRLRRLCVYVNRGKPLVCL